MRLTLLNQNNTIHKTLYAKIVIYRNKTTIELNSNTSRKEKYVNEINIKKLFLPETKMI